MNINKHFKKIVVVLLLIVLFNFCCPKPVHAWGLQDLLNEILAIPAKIFWFIEKGVLVSLNNMFTEDSKDATTENLEIWITPETIISGNFILFDANIFKDPEDYAQDAREILKDENAKPSDYYYDYDDDQNNGESQEGEEEGNSGFNSFLLDGRRHLREIVAGWYVAVRNFAIVAMLSVLVYVGIRMVISTLAQDKAKYKSMFKDWIVALCLLVMMHYIMIGLLTLSSEITKALGGGKVSDTLPKLEEHIENILSVGSPFEYEGMDLGTAYADILLVAGIIYYTIVFAIRYLKREFTILFLVIVGPAACITYPIDKIGDGKAQAYNKWFTEFLYQVLIQPFHLLLYIVLIGSAAEIAENNILYGLVCFAVMKPAESFIREMFGFRDKLSSPLGSLMKAGMARDAISKLTSRLMNGKGGNSGKGGSGGNTGDNDEYNSAPPIQNRNVDNEMLGGGTEGAGQSQPQGEYSYSDDTYTPSNSQTQTLDTSTWGETPQIGSNGDYSTADDSQTQTLDTSTWGATPTIGTNGDYSPAGEQPTQTFNSNTWGIDSSEFGTNQAAVDNASELAGNAAAVATLNDSEAQNSSIPHGQTEADRAQGAQEQQRQLEGWRATRARRRAVHARRMANKYGTTRRGKQWKRRVGRGLGKGIKTIAKGGLIATAALASAGIAAVSGNGAEALIIIEMMLFQLCLE